MINRLYISYFLTGACLLIAPTLVSASHSSSYTNNCSQGDGCGLVNRPFSIFDDWGQFADADSDIPSGQGGQRFDTEYLFYKYNKDDKTLSLGLQTGFDIKDGQYGNYYAGDIALSFDGSTSGAKGAGFEYAVDFGLMTKDYYDLNKVSAAQDSSGNDTGIDVDGGLYEVSLWNDDILHEEASPFAMDDGVIKSALTTNDYGYGYTDRVDNTTSYSNIYDKSYYRIVTFSLDGIVDLSKDFTVDAHWTMSCGNDQINGGFNIAGNQGGGNPVPEPSALALMAIGSISLGLSGYRRRKFIK